MLLVATFRGSKCLSVSQGSGVKNSRWDGLSTNNITCPPMEASGCNVRPSLSTLRPLFCLHKPQSSLLTILYPHPSVKVLGFADNTASSAPLRLLHSLCILPSLPLHPFLLPYSFLLAFVLYTLVFIYKNCRRLLQAPADKSACFLGRH